MVDVNDCKIRGRALDQLIGDFGAPDPRLQESLVRPVVSGALRQPPIRTQLTAGVARRRTSTTSTRSWAGIRPRYAIPFGSMVGFLHPDSRATQRPPRHARPPWSRAWRGEGRDRRHRRRHDGARRCRGTARRASSEPTSTGTPTAKRHLADLAATYAPADRSTTQAAAEEGRLGRLDRRSRPTSGSSSVRCRGCVGRRLVPQARSCSTCRPTPTRRTGGSRSGPAGPSAVRHRRCPPTRSGLTIDPGGGARPRPSAIASSSSSTER